MNKQLKTIVARHNRKRNLTELYHMLNNPDYLACYNQIAGFHVVEQEYFHKHTSPLSGKEEIQKSEEIFSRVFKDNEEMVHILSEELASIVDFTPKCFNDRLKAVKVDKSQKFKLSDDEFYRVDGYSIFIKSKGYLAMVDDDKYWLIYGNKDRIQDIIDKGGFTNYDKYTFIKPQKILRYKITKQIQTKQFGMQIEESILVSDFPSVKAAEKHIIIKANELSKAGCNGSISFQEEDMIWYFLKSFKAK